MRPTPTKSLRRYFGKLSVTSHDVRAPHPDLPDLSGLDVAVALIHHADFHT
jgi:hypothetical protein